MAFYRCGGGGIPSSLKTDMNAVLNKKFGTSADYPPADWPDTVNLMGPLPEATVSGSIVTFSNGADEVPLKSCEVVLSASLDGYSSVDVVSAGKNLFNLVPYLATAYNTPSFSDCMFVKGGSYTFSFDKISDGTTDATSWRYCVTVYDAKGQLVTDWTLSGALAYRATLCSYTNGTNTSNKYVTFNLQGDCYIFIRFWSGNTTADMNMISPMLELGNTASAFEPYSGTTHTATLGRTIHGGVPDVVKGEGTEEYTNTSLADKNYYYSSSLQRFDCVLDGVISSGYMDDFIPPQGYTINHALIIDSTNAPDYTMCIFGGKLYIKNLSCSSVSELVSDMSGKYIVYKLATPSDFTFEPVEINSRLGNNTMWSDGDMSVTYRADINLALGGQ